MEAVILIAVGWALGMVTAIALDKYMYESPMAEFYKNESDRYFSAWIKELNK